MPRRRAFQEKPTVMENFYRAFQSACSNFEQIPPLFYIWKIGKPSPNAEKRLSGGVHPRLPLSLENAVYLLLTH